MNIPTKCSIMIHPREGSSIFLNTASLGANVLRVVADAVEGEENTFSGTVSLMITDHFNYAHRELGEEYQNASSITTSGLADSPVAITVDTVKCLVIVNYECDFYGVKFAAFEALSYAEFVDKVKHQMYRDAMAASNQRGLQDRLAEYTDYDAARLDGEWLG